MDLYSILDGYIEDLSNHKTDKIGGWALTWKWALTQLVKLGDGHLHGNGHSPNWQNWGMGTCTEMGTHPIGKIGWWALARKWHSPNWQNWGMGTYPTGKIGWWALARKWALTQLTKLGDGHLHGNGHLLKTTHNVERQTHRCLYVAVYLIPWSLRRGNEAWYSLTWPWLPGR